MKRILFLCVLLSGGTIEAQTWEAVDMNFPHGDTLLGTAVISFASKNIGWLISDGFVIHGMPPSQPETRVFKTVDGGHNWILQKVFDSDLGITSAVSFDSSHCCAIGGSPGTGVMLTTNDGGTVWSQSKIMDAGGDYFTCLFFWDHQSGIAFNQNRWFTRDAGQSWSKGGDSLKRFPIPSDVCFVNSRFGWMVSYLSRFSTDAGYIAHSTDSGQTWQYQDSVAAVMYAVDFIDSARGSAVGTNGIGSTGFIYSTTDGGAHWTWSQFVGSGPYWNIRFLDDKHGWITMFGKILRTTDGGGTWEAQLQGLQPEFRRLIVLRSEKVAYCFGNNHFQPPFTLMYADLSSLTTAENGERMFPKEFHLAQNYPNPFNPATTISYQLPESGPVALMVFDVLGRVVRTLVNQEQPAGRHTVTFDASDLASGVYFYRMQAAGFAQTMRLLLLR
jgi:photosystem II stability/assembly factor-like uncharacterized protein